ncbi:MULTISPECIES: transcriptional repressor AgaR [unclassified Leeuwenhoekiella]|uniref:transcriptional repressor AgaR n=1 Tax=unclassified Leeuwenhoekiella TaxID=2615029 RepID=UPI000C0F3E19|nr:MULTISPECIES: transcriptional repressor AgaR [unclassified Leeuwenhoekiella]MAS71527.1 DeoR family transcriptional regulator [Zunongwangia sp.]MAW96266.1 DeoR family transcriptional regulator [Leeuwenhoekiella sp.]MBA82757.1 DeoR family transcriptional regulator [Leeuwenhoekiella sp.]PHR95486.1 MAG: DeoR family transcriptional regulator [Leeuwenhoekiella sp.]|tara:strand:+ start:19979 stop:20737 length:759 start_codon:yes stop_codon:yes gene_type:complete
MKKTAYRRSRILEELDTNGQVNVNELSAALGVSEVTIRNDLDKLEKNNLLVRAHGGAFKANNVALPVTEKKKINLEVKRRIGKYAVSLINEEDSIILDSGTTTFEITNNLGGFKRLTVISNALDIVNNLAQYENLEVFMPGGYLKEFSMSLVGPMAERNLRQLYCNKLFLGVDGIKTGHGIFTHHMEEAYLNQLMIEIAEEVIVVADSSKFEKSGLAFICGFDKINAIITDDGLPESKREELRKNNVNVIIA